MDREFETSSMHSTSGAGSSRPTLLQELRDDLLAFVVRAALLALAIPAVAFAAVAAAALSLVLVPLVVLSGGRHDAWRQTGLGRLRGLLGQRGAATRRLPV